MARVNVLNSAGELDLSTAGGGGEFVDNAHLSNNTPYIKNPAQVRLITPPKGLLRLPNGQQHVAFLKQLLETRNKTWTGFNPNLDIETHQIPWGWDRQMLTVPTTTVRQAMNPSMTADSYYDNANGRWWQWFAKTLYAHPDTQRPNFAAMGATPDTWTFEDFSFSVLAWEPNAVFTKPITAVLCHGVTLQNLPEILMERNVTATRTGEEHSIAFNCVYEDGSRVTEMAQAMMDAERAASINPEYRPVSIREIDADVAAANGMSKQREEAMSWS
jgi:hypothetical protein